MFSVHEASQVTVLSKRTSFHLWPAGGSGILESLGTEQEHSPHTKEATKGEETGQHLNYFFTANKGWSRSCSTPY